MEFSSEIIETMRRDNPFDSHTFAHIVDRRRRNLWSTTVRWCALVLFYILPPLIPDLRQNDGSTDDDHFNPQAEEEREREGATDTVIGQLKAVVGQSVGYIVK